MGSTLGSTSDPKDLIPGDAGKLGGLEGALDKWSKTFNDIGNGLRDLRINGWVGQASDVFWPTLANEKKNWYLASDAMSGASGAVKSYASTLSWAQGQAATAIDMWKGGDHEGAEHLLSNARKQLKQEAQTLAKKLNDLAGSASDSPDWLVATRSGVDAQQWATAHNVGKAAISPDDWKKEKKKWITDANSHWRQREKQFGKDADNNWYLRNKPGEPGDDGDGDTPGKQKIGTDIKIAEWSANADAWSAGVSGKTDWGGLTLQGGAKISTLGVDGSVGASVVNGQFQAGASGTAYLAQASANGSLNYGVLGLQGEGKVFVGADASAKGSIGKTGVHAGAEAFAGAKASGSVSADVAGVGAGVNGEAWAGVGAEAKADLGIKNGKFTIGGEAGIGLGVGGKVGVNITVDPGKVVHSVEDAADAVGGWFS